MRRDVRLVRRSFEQAAPAYDHYAELQRQLGGELVARVAGRLAPAARWLDLGSGTGWVANEMRRRQAGCTVIAVDAAAAMLQGSGYHTPAGAALCAWAEALPLAAGCCDGIVSNLMLQWCEQPAAVFAECARVLKVGGWLALCTLGPNTLSELRRAWGEVDRLRHVNEFPAVEELLGALSAGGFSQIQWETRLLQPRYTDPLALMRELKGLGAHNLDGERRRALTGQAAWTRLLAAYPRDAAGGCCASFEALFLVAQRGEG